MFTIKKKPLTPNIIWDGSTGKPLCNFGHKGMITTNDRNLAEKLAALGHEVTGEAEEPAPQEDDVENAPQEETTASESRAEQSDGTTSEAPVQQEATSTGKGEKKQKAR